ncbi:hypothetical protein ACFLTA_02450 [Bacteroidota bacterium]
MAKVTYLLGAGASADCIPVNDGLEKDITKRFLPFLDKYIRSKNVHLKKPKLLSDIQSFDKIITGNPTVDILAKQFFSRGQSNKLEELKKWLTIYFHFLQYTKDPDQRYNRFLAVITGNKFAEVVLRPNVKVITWNYDMQFEIALSKYISGEEQSMEQLQKILGVFPRVTMSIAQLMLGDDIEIYTPNQFQIVRLNGTAGVYPIEDNSSFQTHFDVMKTNYRKGGSEGELTPDQLENLLFEYDGMHKYITTLSYAWEIPPEENQGLKLAKQIANETEVLVVIGYSFPAVNRIFDDEIFKKMNKVERIIIQDPFMDKSNFEYIKSRLENIVPVDLRGKITYRDIKHEFILPE